MTPPVDREHSELQSRRAERAEFIDVARKASELGCRAPTGLALLPRNLETAASSDELVYESTASTIRKLWRQAAIDETPIEPRGEHFSETHEKAFAAWIGPTIFVGFALWTQNPHALSLALGVVSNYLTALFRGIEDMRPVSFSIVVETKRGTCLKVDYNGPASQMGRMVAVVRQIAHE